LSLTVVLPSFFCGGLQLLLGQARVDPVKPNLKFISLVTLISINYINDSKALPAAFKNPVPDFICFLELFTLHF
jgi:hypothetical protein